MNNSLLINIKKTNRRYSTQRRIVVKKQTGDDGGNAHNSCVVYMHRGNEGLHLYI